MQDCWKVLEQKNKVIIATDSFKGSASSIEVGKFIREGIRRVSKDVQIEIVPIADGGEGTVEALVEGLDGEYIKKTVVGPYHTPVEARFGLIHNQKTAVIEMAEASGLHLVKKNEMNPFEATSYGTGQLIQAALDQEVENIYIGLGGSATNDGGFGMARALGAVFLDNDNREIEQGVLHFGSIKKIDITNLDPRLKKVSVIILSDVTNPLCGVNGASYIYGTQKGAQEKDLLVYDELLYELGRRLEETFHTPLIDAEGAGAAGGLGAGLMAFCQAEMRRGIEEILFLTGFDTRLKNASLVITGEGKMDGQSLRGKAPIGVAQHAKKEDVSVIAIVGSADDDLSGIYKNGIDLVVPIVNKPMTLEEAIKNAGTLIPNAGEQAYRAFLLHRKKLIEKSTECGGGQNVYI